MTIITECRSCNSKNIKTFFELGNQPLANALLHESLDNEEKYPLTLCFCEDCNLVQLNYTVDPKILFSEYLWVTSTSSTARDYANKFYVNALKRVTSSHINYVLEIASNDGTFLKPFLENGHSVVGVDPAQNIAKMANEAGVKTINAFFDDCVSKEIVEEFGYPSIVFARNVLPHVANLHEFVEGLKYAVGDETTLILEVHYSGVIIEEIHYDSIYHEHLCYFTLLSLENLLNAHGLFIFDIEQSPISGGSIVVYMKNQQIEKTYALKKFTEIERAHGYNSFDKWREFADLSHKHKQLLKDMINENLNVGKSIVAYGASARSSTMLNFCEITSKQIPIIADANLMKQGLYTPGTHLKIVSPEDAIAIRPDLIVLLAWNFEMEITQILENQLAYSGDVLVPLPYPPKIKTVGRSLK